MKKYLEALDNYVDIKIRYSDLDLNEFRYIDFKKELDNAKNELDLSLHLLIKELK